MASSYTQCVARYAQRQLHQIGKYLKTGLVTLGETGTGRVRLDKKANNFEIWVRRHNGADPVFELRFETFNGRGLFRTQQRSGLTSTPAGNTGVSGRLDLDELIQTSFVHVSDLRSHLSFVDDAAERLSTLPTGIWLPIFINDHGRLDVGGSNRGAPSHQKSASQTPVAAPKPSPSTERKSASNYIFELESELERAQEHIVALKARIDDLEDQVVRLGGQLSPLVLDARPKSMETTG